MIYETEYKNDLVSGTSIYVRVPENHVDDKALYTILKDPPGFLLPFHYRNVDGQVEFVYKAATALDFESLYGCYSSGQYAEIWCNLLHPLLDCGDWFLRPYSFVLNVQNLYRDAGKTSIRYIYIPSVQDCSGLSALKEMFITLASRISTHDAELELKVLRAVMNDFSPKNLVQLLKPSIPAFSATVAPAQETTAAKILPPQVSPASQLICDVEKAAEQTARFEPENSDEIFINLSAESFLSKKAKKKETLLDMGIPNEKKQKRFAKKQKQQSDGFFHRLRHAGKDIIIE